MPFPDEWKKCETWYILYVYSVNSAKVFTQTISTYRDAP